MRKVIEFCPHLQSSNMAEKSLAGLPPPSLASPSHQNGRIKGVTPKHPAAPHHNGSLEAGPGCSASLSASSSTSASSSPRGTLRTPGGLVSPPSGPDPAGGSTRPRGQSFGSALSPRTRTSRSRHGSSQQEEPEALLDLILECQGQRLEDQRASLSLLPEPGPAALCEACSPNQAALPSLDFYYMLIHFQSDRMEDQRCSLPDLEDVVSLVPEGQEDFFSLVQRVQSRRMDEQRASLHTHSSAPPNTTSTTAIVTDEEQSLKEFFTV